MKKIPLHELTSPDVPMRANLGDVLWSLAVEIQGLRVAIEELRDANKNPPDADN